jgi:TolB-like protein
VRYRFGHCELDLKTVELYREGEAVAIEPQVYQLLCYLVKHAERVIGKDELLDMLWQGRYVSEATLANCVKLARQAIGDDGQAQRFIKTIRGHGYRFVGDLSRAAGAGNVLQSAHTAADEAPVLPALPSVALVGFVDVGAHESGALLAEGLAVDLNARLAQLHGLFVIARDSAKRFSLAATSLTEIGRQLGVRYIIHGTTQRTDNRIRVTVNLLQADTQQVIWAEQFDRVLDDLFGVQDDIVGAIVAAVLPEIDRAEMERSRLLPTEHLGAWECYHRAMWHNFRFTAEDSDQARSLLLKAADMDPNFARAYAGLSFNHFLHAFLDTHSDQDSQIAAALDYAHKSVGLDGRDSINHWVLGRALFLSRRHEEALSALDRALSANPNYAQGRYARGFVGVHAGEPERALNDLDMARRLSPFDPLLFAMKSSRAISLAVQGDPQTASKWAVEATQEPNAHFHIHAIAGACLHMAGQAEAASGAIAKARDIHPNYSVATFERSFPHHVRAHRALFRDALHGAGLPH